MSKDKERYVIVTTARKGVFAGILESGSIGGNTTLRDARMVMFWSSETRSVIGLAAKGPASGSRVSDAAPAIELDGVTAIIDCSEVARKAIEDAPWS